MRKGSCIYYTYTQNYQLRKRRVFTSLDVKTEDKNLGHNDLSNSWTTKKEKDVCLEGNEQSFCVRTYHHQYCWTPLVQSNVLNSEDTKRCGIFPVYENVQCNCGKKIIYFKIWILVKVWPTKYLMNVWLRHQCCSRSS